MTTFEVRARPLSGVRRRDKRHSTLLLVTALAVVGILLYRLVTRTTSTDDARIEARITSISPRVRGHVRALHVRDNQKVEAGQLLLEVELDELTSQIEVLQAERDGASATLRTARAQVALTERAAHASLTQARGGVLQAGYGLRALNATTKQAEQALRIARAHRERLENEPRRAASETASNASAQNASEGALPSPAASPDAQHAQALEQARSAEAAAQAQLDRVLAARSTSWGSIVAARGKLEEASSLPEQLEVARANVAQAEANLAQAEARLKLAQRSSAAGLVRAPAAGEVAQLSAVVGQLVTPDEPVLAIAASDRWVVATFDDAQREHIRPGQAAKITVAQRGAEPLGAHVESVAPSEVRLRFDHHEQARALEPGMRAAVSVLVED